MVVGMDSGGDLGDGRFAERLLEEWSRAVKVVFFTQKWSFWAFIGAGFKLFSRHPWIKIVIMCGNYNRFD
jgi:hypothetical protein